MQDVRAQVNSGYDMVITNHQISQFRNATHRTAWCSIRSLNLKRTNVTSVTATTLLILYWA
jgi:hypothetical protein